MLVRDMHNIFGHNTREKTKSLLLMMILVTTALIISSGIFFAVDRLGSAFWVSMVISFLAGQIIVLTPILFYIRKLIQKQESISKSIKNIGNGRLHLRRQPEKAEPFSRIAESIHFANRELAEKLKSIRKNTNRLAYLEEELSSRFRPRGMADRQTVDLVCQLKICTSRLKNDLGDFILEDKNGSNSETENGHYSNRV